MQEKNTQASAASNLLPVVTPPPTWPHPSPASAYLPHAGQQWVDPTMVDNLKRQVDQLNSQLSSTREENTRLKADIHSEAERGSGKDVEATIVPNQVVKNASSG